MMTLAAVTGVKRPMGAGLFAAALMAVVGVRSAGLAADAPRLFSVAVRITYPNGFVYEHAFATGVPTSDLSAILQACGQGHAYGSGAGSSVMPFLTDASTSEGPLGERPLPPGRIVSPSDRSGTVPFGRRLMRGPVLSTIRPSPSWSAAKALLARASDEFPESMVITLLPADSGGHAVIIAAR